MFLIQIPLGTSSEPAYLTQYNLSLGAYFFLICQWVKIMKIEISQLMINKMN